MRDSFSVVPFVVVTTKGPTPKLPLTEALGVGIHKRITMKRLLLLIIILFSKPAFSCSCLSDVGLTIEEAVEKATDRVYAVVVADALQIEYFNKNNFSLPEGFNREDVYRQVTTFQVLHSWKGDLSGIIETDIVTICCVCGYSFSVGGTYLLYLSAPNKAGKFSTSTCSRTSLLKNALDDIQVLNNLTPNKPFNGGLRPETPQAPLAAPH